MLPRRFCSGFAFGLLLPLIIGCAASIGSSELSDAAPVVVAPTPSKPAMIKPLRTGKSGIQGKVMRQSGDFMPRIRVPSAKPMPPRNQTQPVQTTVWVFSGRIPAEGTRWPVSDAENHPQLVGTVKSKADGSFAIALPPGEYTLFAQDGSDLYLNAFAGDGNYATVQVKPGEATPLSLVNNEQATF